MSRPWASQHLGLPIERQMPGVFGDQHRGDHRLGRQPALDQPFGRRRLHHRLLAGPAGVFGTVRHDHPELRRDHVEPLARSPRRSHAWATGSRGSWCPRARSSHARAADGREARRDWRGAFRRAPLRPPGPSCRRRLRLPQWLARYPRTPERAGRDRASPNAGQIACAAVGAADAAGGRFCDSAWSRSAIAASRSARAVASSACSAAISVGS